MSTSTPDTPTDHVIRQLHGQIYRGFTRLTVEGRQPANEVLAGFESLFATATAVLKWRTTLPHSYDPEDQVLLDSVHGSSVDRLPAFDMDYIDTELSTTVRAIEVSTAPMVGNRGELHIQWPTDSVSMTNMTNWNVPLRSAPNPIPSTAREEPSKKQRRRRDTTSKEKAYCRWPNGTAVHDTMSAKLEGSRKLPTLVLLSAGFASPDAVFELLKQLTKSGGWEMIPLPGVSVAVPVLMAKLEQIDYGKEALVFLRRVYLAQLCERFHEKILDPSPTSDLLGKRKRTCGTRKSSEVLDVMTDELVSDTANDMDDTHELRIKRRKHLQNCLRAGKFYHRLSSEFSYAALAFLPKEICRSRLETLLDEEMDVVMSTLIDRSVYLKRLCNQALVAIRLPKSESAIATDSLRMSEISDRAEYDSDDLVISIQRYCQAAYHTHVSAGEHPSDENNHYDVEE